MKKVLSLIIILSLLLGIVPIFAEIESTEVDVNLASGGITINGTEIDNSKEAYPFVSYKDITYFPMTWDFAKSMGLATEWTPEIGLQISKSGSGEAVKLTPTATNDLSKSYKASISSSKIKVEGKYIDNVTEEFPILTFRDITYFPMTWRFMVEEFGTDYTWDAETGLNIASKEKTQEVSVISPDELIGNETIINFKFVNGEYEFTVTKEHLPEDVRASVVALGQNGSNLNPRAFTKKELHGYIEPLSSPIAPEYWVDERSGDVGIDNFFLMRAIDKNGGIVGYFYLYKVIEGDNKVEFIKFDNELREEVLIDYFAWQEEMTKNTVELTTKDFEVEQSLSNDNITIFIDKDILPTGNYSIGDGGYGGNSIVMTTLAEYANGGYNRYLELREHTVRPYVDFVGINTTSSRLFSSGRAWLSVKDAEGKLLYYIDKSKLNENIVIENSSKTAYIEFEGTTNGQVDIEIFKTVEFKIEYDGKVIYFKKGVYVDSYGNQILDMPWINTEGGTVTTSTGEVTTYITNIGPFRFDPTKSLKITVIDDKDFDIIVNK
jgi:hypothetical protein